jgi:hypothetical protein
MWDRRGTTVDEAAPSALVKEDDMPTPSDEEIDAAVRKSFADRGAGADDAELAGVIQTVRGYLRLPINRQAPLDPVSQRMADFLITGRRNMPPFPYRPELEPLLRNLFEEAGVPVPPHATIATLVNLAIGWIIERGSPILPGARGAVVRDFMGCYLLGT